MVPGLAFAGAVLSGEVAIVLGAAAFLALGLVAAAQWLLQAWLCGQLALVVEMLADTADRVTTLSDVGRTDVQ